MFSLGKDPYRDLDLTPDLFGQQERLLFALRGSKRTISDIGGTFARALPGDKEACRAYQEADEAVRRVSADVDKRKSDLGPARYIRWGNFCLTWLELRSGLSTTSPAVVMTRAASARQYATLCAEEIARLPVRATVTPAPEKSASASASAATISTLHPHKEIGWKRVILTGGVVAGVILLIKRVFRAREA